MSEETKNPETNENSTNPENSIGKESSAQAASPATDTAVAPKGTSEGVTAQDAPKQEATPQASASQEAPPQEAPPQASKPAEGTQDTKAQDTKVEDTRTEGTTRSGVSLRELSSKRGTTVMEEVGKQGSKREFVPAKVQPTETKSPQRRRQHSDSSRITEPQTTEDGEDFTDRLVSVNRVAKVVKGGRRFGFSALVVVGNNNGSAGFGMGKAKEISDAVRKATDEGKHKMVKIMLREGRTLHHDIVGHYGSGRVVMRAATAGTGIIAGGPIRALFEVLGVKDVVAKSIGSSNPHNMVKAAFEGLLRVRSPRAIAAKRGIAKPETDQAENTAKAPRGKSPMGKAARGKDSAGKDSAGKNLGSNSPATPKSAIAKTASKPEAKKPATKATEVQKPSTKATEAKTPATQATEASKPATETPKPAPQATDSKATEAKEAKPSPTKAKQAEPAKAEGN